MAEPRKEKSLKETKGGRSDFFFFTLLCHWLVLLIFLFLLFSACQSPSLSRGKVRLFAFAVTTV